MAKQTTRPAISTTNRENVYSLFWSKERRKNDVSAVVVVYFSPLSLSLSLGFLLHRIRRRTHTELTNDTHRAYSFNCESSLHLSAIIMSILYYTINNSVFTNFAFYSTASLVKMMSMSALTAMKRMSKDVRLDGHSFVKPSSFITLLRRCSPIQKISPWHATKQSS